MKNRFPFSAALALATLVQAWPLQAREPGQQQAPGQQTQEPIGPFRGLFGGSEMGRQGHQALNFTFSALGGYDDNVLAESAPVEPGLQVGGTYTALRAQLVYSRQGRHVSFYTSGGSGYRYYPDQAYLNGAMPWVNAELSSDLGRHTRFILNGEASYWPSYSFDLFPDLTASRTPEQVVTGSADRAVVSEPSFNYSARAWLNRRLSPRSALTASYRFQHAAFGGDRRPLDDQWIGADYSRSRSGTLEFRVGYGLTRSRSSGVDAPPAYAHDLEFSVERSVARAGRRSALGFSIGPTVIDEPLGVSYRAVARAYANWQVGRTWYLRTAYRRTHQFVQGFARPFYGDFLDITTYGLVGSRVELSGAGAYSSGHIGLGSQAERLDAYTGTVGLRVGIVRYLALNAEYVYYHYLFDEGALLPPGVSRGLNRNGIRAGVTVWVPLLR